MPIEDHDACKLLRSFICLVDTVDEIFARKEYNTEEYLMKKKVILISCAVSNQQSNYINHLHINCWCYISFYNDDDSYDYDDFDCRTSESCHVV